MNLKSQQTEAKTQKNVPECRRESPVLLRAARAQFSADVPKEFAPAPAVSLKADIFLFAEVLEELSSDEFIATCLRS